MIRGVTYHDLKTSVTLPRIDSLKIFARIGAMSEDIFLRSQVDVGIKQAPLVWKSLNQLHCFYHVCALEYIECHRYGVMAWNDGVGAEDDASRTFNL